MKFLNKLSTNKTEKSKNNKNSKNKKNNDVNIFPLPIKKINDIVQLEDNTYKIIAKVSPINADLMDNDTLSDIADCIQGAIVSYPGRLQILIQSEYVDIEKNILNMDKMQEKLTSELKIELLEEQKKHLYSMSKKTNNVLNFYIILESNEKDYFIAEQILEDYLQTIKTELENSNLFVERLYEQEIKQMIYEKLNPVSSQSEPLKDYFEINNIMPEHSMIDKDGRHLEVEEFVYRHFVISGYPLKVDKYRWLRKLFNFKGSFTVSLVLTQKDKSKIQKQLSKAVNEISRKEKDYENDEAKRQKYEKEAQSAKDMIAELGNDNTTLYDVNITIQIGHKDRKELERLVNSLRAKISSTYLQATELRNKEYMPFFNCLPILPNNKITQNYVWNLSSTDIASLIIFDSSELMEEFGLLIGENTKSNGLVILDFYNRIYNNPHLAIIADSGSGKSFWIGCNIIRDLPYMDYIIQFDVDGSAKFPWANKYKFNGISGIKINPFHIRNSIISKDGEEEENNNVGSFLLTKVMDLIVFFKWILPDMTPFEESLLEEDIRDTYKRFNLTFESKELPEVFPTMTDFSKVIQEKIENKDIDNSLKAIECRTNLKASLNPYTNGAYSSIFNGQTNWDYKLHTIFDVSELPEAVQKPLYDLLLKDTWQFCKKHGTLDKMTNRVLKKVIIDECHRFADENNPQTLKFISTELLKQSRKFGINVITATQNISDLTSIKKYGQAIIDNSYFKIFFRLGENDHETAKKLYKLSDEEMKIVSGSGTKGKGSKGRGIFMAGSQRVLFQSRASKYELEILDPAQFEEIYKVKSRFRG